MKQKQINAPPNATVAIGALRLRPFLQLQEHFLIYHHHLHTQYMQVVIILLQLLHHSFSARLTSA